MTIGLRSLADTGGLMSNGGQDNKPSMALVALITAVISLITSVVTAAAPYVSRLTQSWQENRAKTELLSYLPEDTRATCSTATSNYFQGTLIALECAPKGINSFSVALYDNSKDLYKRYNKRIDELKMRYGRGKGCLKKGQTEWRFSEGDKPAAGRAVCYWDDDGSAWIEWTLTDLNVYVFANGKDMDSVYRWWRNFYIGSSD